MGPPGAIDDVLEVIDITHMGFPKAIGYAKARYFWPKMSQSVEAHCNNCLICIKHSDAKSAGGRTSSAGLASLCFMHIRQLLQCASTDWDILGQKYLAFAYPIAFGKPMWQMSMTSKTSSMAPGGTRNFVPSKTNSFCCRLFSTT